ILAQPRAPGLWSMTAVRWNEPHLTDPFCGWMQLQNRPAKTSHVLVLARELDQAERLRSADFFPHTALAVLHAVGEIRCDIARVDRIEGRIRNRPDGQPAQIRENTLEKIV